MSKPANKTLIGVFVLGAIVLVIIAIVLFGSGKLFRKTVQAVCYFQGSVGGLSVGAPVVFRGVKIGTVKEITLRYDPKSTFVVIPVLLDMEYKTREGIHSLEEYRLELRRLIERGLKAQLEMQSFLTGQYQVGLDFYPDKPIKLVGAEPTYVEIPTIPTPLQELAKKIEQLPIEDIVRDLASAVAGINRMVNSPEITRTVQSISRAAEETRILVNNLNAKIEPVVTGIEGTVGDARHLLQEMDGNVGRMAAGVNDAMKDIQKLTQDVQKVAFNVNDQVQPISTSLQDTLKDAQKLLRDLDGKATALASSLDETVKDGQKVLRNLDGKASALASSLDETVKDTQKLVRNIDKQIEPLGSSVQKTLTSVEKTSDEAGATLRQAQQTLGALEGDLGEDSELVYELKKAIKGIGVAVRAIQDLAKSLDEQPESVIFGKKRLGR